MFGDIVNDQMQLNDAGRMIQSAWEALPERFPTVELDEFGIMPNHIHGIIVITNVVGATLVVARDMMHDGNQAGTSPAPTARGDSSDDGIRAESGPAPTFPALGGIVVAFANSGVITGSVMIILGADISIAGLPAKNLERSASDH